MKIVNATIKDVLLGFEDHGIFACSIMLDYGDSGSQDFGNYSLEGENGIEFLKRILTVFEVGDFKKLEGLNVRVKRGDNYNSLIEQIGHITKDNWVDPKEIFKN